MTYEFIVTTRDQHDVIDERVHAVQKRLPTQGKALLMSDDEGSAAGTATVAALGIFGVGLLLAVPMMLLLLLTFTIMLGGFGVLLGPLIGLFGAGASGVPANLPSEQQISVVVQGDGKGRFDTKTVAADLVQPIQKAGQLCPEIGPVVIAAQLEQASNFDRNSVGPAGEQGIAQLPPAVFTQFGQDDDGNGETSALDAEDAVMALGRFDCSLVSQLRDLVIDVDGGGNADLLTLTLAAVKAGVGPVREARAVPATEEVQIYVAQTRSRFPKFQGLIKAK